VYSSHVVVPRMSIICCVPINHLKGLNMVSLNFLESRSRSLIPLCFSAKEVIMLKSPPMIQWLFSIISLILCRIQRKLIFSNEFEVHRRWRCNLSRLIQLIEKWLRARI
jgi:hypothetical protein